MGGLRGGCQAPTPLQPSWGQGFECRTALEGPLARGGTPLRRTGAGGSPGRHAHRLSSPSHHWRWK